MLLGFSFPFLFVLGTVFAKQHQCKNAFRPSAYVGKVRVPTNCNLESTADCPRSWKSGIPEGSETNFPTISKKFLRCHEGLSFCGYVPINPKNGEVLGRSGVTFGAGIDLGSKSKTSLEFLPIAVLAKLGPYIGLRRNLAACAVIERPLVLSSNERNQLIDAVTDETIKNVSKNYNYARVKDALPFASLPRGIRTAIVSVWYQFGYPSAYPKFWGLVTSNDWVGAVKELRNFYKRPGKQERGDLRRRNDEADIIEATLQKCNRSVDLVFLVDESGSVSVESFNKSLQFIKNFIQAFPDDKLKGNTGTRFGLSTFSTMYQSHFYLLNYTERSSYLAAVNRVVRKGGSTNLGAALEQILKDQFTNKRGLRPEEDGLPRVLIVLTDGIATDSVKIPSKNVQDRNIVIYVIGIGKFDKDGLSEIATSTFHVHILSSYLKLESFITTITSSTCNEPQPLSLNQTIKTNVVKDSFQYFSYNINRSSNLEIKVKDLAGDTLVYVSRSNPHPYEFDNDFSFDISHQEDKIIVISATGSITAKIRRSTEDGSTKTIYVSVTAASDSAVFTIEGNECDPSKCKEGTNEIVKNNARSMIKSPVSDGFAFAVMLVVARLLAET